MEAVWVRMQGSAPGVQAHYGCNGGGLRMGRWSSPPRPSAWNAGTEAGWNVTGLIGGSLQGETPDLPEPIPETLAENRFLLVPSAASGTQGQSRGKPF